MRQLCRRAMLRTGASIGLSALWELPKAERIQVRSDLCLTIFGSNENLMLGEFEFLGDYPRDRENGWDEEAQGVAHDDGHWFISQRDKIWKLPLSHDLNREVTGREPGVTVVELTSLPFPGYNHIGDIDHYQGYLYVPIESESNENRPIVAVFDAATLRLEWSAELSAQSQAPWCAVNPKDGRLYSSNFRMGASGRPWLVCYRIENNTLTYKRGFSLKNADGEPIDIERIQGGTFSDNGRLYLVSDTRCGGILGFDLASEQLIAHTIVDYHPSGFFGINEELQGITIWNMDALKVDNPNLGGQFHMLMLDITGDDTMWFKHFQVRDEDIDLF